MSEWRLGQAMPVELRGDFEIVRADGRPYERDEWPLVRSITSGEEVVDEEYFTILPDGSRLTVHCSSSPIYDAAGRIVAGVLLMDDVSAQKRVEERLASHANLVDNIEDAVIATDGRFVVTAWNPGAERLYGQTADEVVGRHVNDVIQTELSDAEKAARSRLIAEKGRSRIEVVAYRADGTPVDVELVNVAIRGPGGEVTGYLGIHRDISERKRAEHSLRESQRRTETILESITDEFYALDRAWRFTYLNGRAFARMRQVTSARTRDELLGTSVFEVLPGEKGSSAHREMLRALGEQKATYFEYRFRGTDTWREIHAYPSEEGLSVYSREITDRKRAEEERARRLRQQALVAELGRRALASSDLQALMDDAVALVARTLDVELAGVAEIAATGEGVILRAGVGWRLGVVGSRIGRTGRDSQVGYTLLRGEPVISEDQANDPRFRPSAIAREHEVVSALSVTIATVDEPFGVLEALSTRRRRFSEGDVSFVQAVANVLARATDRGRAQQRLGEVREVERRRIARDLHDEALQGLTDALVQTNRGRSAGLDAKAAGRLAATLQGVSQQLRGAIYDLRLTDAERRPFPDALRAEVDVHRAIAVDYEISLEMAADIPTELPANHSRQLLRIVGEALTNARRHSGARHVQVSARGFEGRLRVDVTDDGHGFDPAGERPGAYGAGIEGMRERAALVDGDLDIQSRPGNGTTVRLELRPPEHEAPRTRARILLVEDHTAVREAIAAMLARESDLDVVGQAASLAEARPMLEDIDVAVVDLRLPDGFGGDLIRELRTVNPQARALVLSASIDPVDIARSVESGAADTLDKTAHLDELVDAVRRLHRGAASRR
jgi:PAS domain S-box-containing protein